jgi:hypothetical protein
MFFLRQMLSLTPFFFGAIAEQLATDSQSGDLESDGGYDVRSLRRSPIFSSLPSRIDPPRLPSGPRSPHSLPDSISNPSHVPTFHTIDVTSGQSRHSLAWPGPWLLT